MLTAIKKIRKKYLDGKEFVKNTLLDGRVDGWVGGWVEAKAGLRIAYSNQKSQSVIVYNYVPFHADGWVNYSSTTRGVSESSHFLETRSRVLMKNSMR